MQDALGPGGWIALVALVVGFLVRLLKAAKLNAMLCWLGLPPISKAALPWVALGLGFASMALEAKLGGATWSAALGAGLVGVMSGALAIAGNETIAAGISKMLPRTGAVVFGKRIAARPLSSTDNTI